MKDEINPLFNSGLDLLGMCIQGNEREAAYLNHFSWIFIGAEFIVFKETISSLNFALI